MSLEGIKISKSQFCIPIGETALYIVSHYTV